MTARRVKIEDLTNGEYYKREGFEPNFVVTPRGIKVSRVHVIATVVDTYQNDEGSYGALTLDDGSDTIRAKFFQELEPMDGVHEGDIIEVVGKVREYDDEMYVQPELVRHRTIKDEMLQELEVAELRTRWAEAADQAEELLEDGKEAEDVRQELKGEGMDEGEIDAIIEHVQADDAEPQIEESDVSGESDGGARIAREDEQEEDSQAESLITTAIEQHDEGDGASYDDIIESVDLPEEQVDSVINDLLSDGTCYEPKPGKIKKL